MKHRRGSSLVTLTQLVGIQNNHSADPAKGKQVVDAMVSSKDILHGTGTTGPRPRWTPPAAGWTKLNVDGSFCATTGTAGAGMILRDSSGVIIFSSCRELRSCAEPLEVELLACMEGLNLALEWTQQHIELEMDSLMALNMLKAVERDRSCYAMLTDQIRRLLGDGRLVKLAHARREQYGISHHLAAFGRIKKRTVVWLGSGPSEVPDLCKKEIDPE